MRRATGHLTCGSQELNISIHALREEGDPAVPCKLSRRPISIHALREEGDHKMMATAQANAIFLSTPSVRRATGFTVNVAHATNISIHALREEGDSR